MMLAEAVSAPPAIAAQMVQLAGAAGCGPGQISVGLDRENGAFDDMSRTGVLLVLRNIGPAACAVPALPALVFADHAGRPLDVVARNPFRGPTGQSLGHGPVVLPVVIPPAAEATAVLRWVTGDVYPGHHCLVPATVSLRVGPDIQTTAFATRFCGEAGQPVPFDQGRLQTDPVLPADRP